MKSRDYEYSKLKRQLRHDENQGKKTLDWKLSKEKVDYIRNLGYEVKPYLYYVHTKNISSPALRQKYPLLKKLHFKKMMEGKSYVAIKLKPEDIRVLEYYGVSYSPFRYIIYLQNRS